MGKNKYLNSHSYRGNIIFQVRQINIQIDLLNYSLAQKMINELIDEYEDDYGLLKCQARLYLLNHRIDEALEIYNKIDERLVFARKAFIYFIKNDATELRRIFETYYQSPIDSELDYVHEVKYQLLSYFGFPLNTPWDELKYDYKQRYSYSEERAIKHIKNRHFITSTLSEEDYYDDLSNEEKTFFREDIVCEELFEELKKLVIENQDKGKIVKGAMQYIFEYPNIACERQSGRINYVTIITTPGTTNILTMFPCTVKDAFYIPVLKNVDSSKVRTRESNIDKFNRKYNINQ